MRYKLKPKKEKPKIGDTRTRSFFAWFPIQLEREIRWLEQVTIKEFYGLFGWGYWYFVDEDG